MRKDEKIDKFHYHEALDRSSMLTDLVCDYLSNHPVILAHPDLLRKANIAQTALFSIYQELGTITIKGNQNQ